MDGSFLSSSFLAASGTAGAPASVNPPSVWQTFASTKGADGTRPVTSEGGAIVPGTAGVMGSYTNLGVLHATQAMHEIEIVVHTVGVAVSNRMVSIDVAVDNAGGTSFPGNEKIRDILCGAPQGISTAQDSRWTFRLTIPAGASIGVRGSTLDATVTAFRVVVNGKGNPTDSTLERTGTGVQTLGVPLSGTVSGTSITPGQAAEGAWVEVGTLAQAVFALEFGYSIDDTTMTSLLLDVDIAIGDATTKRIYIANAPVVTGANENIMKRAAFAYCVGASGEKVYARAHCSGVPDALNTIAVYAMY